MRLIAVLLGLLLARPALAQPSPAILDLPAFPGLSERGKAEAQRMLTRNLPRAFALGPEGRFAWQSGGAEGEVEQKALEACGRSGATCRIIARDLAIVAPGAAPPAPAPSGLAISDMNHETVPDPRFLWWGRSGRRGCWSSPMGVGRAAATAEAASRNPGRGTSTMPASMSGASTATPMWMRRRAPRAG